MKLFILFAFSLSTAVSHETLTTHLRASSAGSTQSKVKGTRWASGPRKPRGRARHQQAARAHSNCMNQCLARETDAVCKLECPEVVAEDLLPSPDVKGSNSNDADANMSDLSEGSRSVDEVVEPEEILTDLGVGGARTRNYERNQRCIQNCVKNSSSQRPRNQCRINCTGNGTAVGPGKTHTAPVPAQISRARAFCLEGCKSDPSCEAKCPNGDVGAVA